VLALTLEQLLTLVGAGAALLVLLFVLRALLRLTRTVLRLGCLGIVIVLAIIFAVMHGFGG
jgi:hypothetical protein